jgi:transposase
MVCGAKKKESALVQYCNGFYAPNYHSISDFRKQNPSGLKTCSNFVSFLKDADLIGCEIIAIEQKSRAHNSKKAINQKKMRDT